MGIFLTKTNTYSLIKQKKTSEVPYLSNLLISFVAMKLYLIAGEASGDLHGSNLLKALYQKDSTLDCRAWGGDLMSKSGAKIVKHYRDLAFMGFIEVIRNLKTILNNIASCKKDILEFQPDALILIDYPGFNLRIAKWAKKRGIRVIYYISPQIWAWHSSRVHQIKRDVEKMLVILPFEKDFYAKYGMEVEYVGHPLLDAMLQNNALPDDFEKFPKPVIALLPGSRMQEIRLILPKMMAIVSHFPAEQFVIAASTSLSLKLFQEYLDKNPNLRVIQGKTYEILKQSKAALVKSGTSTLETALLNVPQVVCYEGSPVSYAIAKRVINVKYISLVNLIANKPLVEELIQEKLTQENLKVALQNILLTKNAKKMQQEYADLRVLLGGGGASERAAEAIIKHIS
jgi:lipid-A-disaccharide synthase